MKILEYLLLPCFFICFLLFSNCRKSQLKELPSIENTSETEVFAFRLNDKIWSYRVPKYFIPVPSLHSCRGVCINYSEDNFFAISADRVTSNQSIDQFTHLESEANGIGKYNLLSETSYSDENTSHCSSDLVGMGYWLDTLSNNFIEIIDFQKDSTGKLISVAGFFEFVAINENCSDTMRIEDGRFKWTKT